MGPTRRNTDERRFPPDDPNDMLARQRVEAFGRNGRGPARGSSGRRDSRAGQRCRNSALEAVGTQRGRSRSFCPKSCESLMYMHC